MKGGDFWEGPGEERGGAGWWEGGVYGYFVFSASW